MMANSNAHVARALCRLMLTRSEKNEIRGRGEVDSRVSFRCFARSGKIVSLSKEQNHSELPGLLFRDTDLPFSRERHNSTHNKFTCSYIHRTFLRNSRVIFVPLFLRSSRSLVHALDKCASFGQVNEEARYLLDAAVMYCPLVFINSFCAACETGRIWNPKIYDRPLH